MQTDANMMHIDAEAHARARGPPPCTYALDQDNEMAHHIVSSMSPNYASHEVINRMRRTCKCLQKTTTKALEAPPWRELESGRKFVAREMLSLLYEVPPGTTEINPLTKRRELPIHDVGFDSILRILDESHEIEYKAHARLVGEVLTVMERFLPDSLYGMVHVDACVQFHKLCEAVAAAMQRVLLKIKARPTSDAPTPICETPNREVILIGIRILNKVCRYEQHVVEPRTYMLSQNCILHVLRVFVSDKLHEPIDMPVVMSLWSSEAFAHVVDINDPNRAPHPRKLKMLRMLMTTSIQNGTNNTVSTMAQIILERRFARPHKFRAFNVLRTYMYQNPEEPNPDNQNDTKWPNEYMRLLESANPTLRKEDPKQCKRIMNSFKNTIAALCFMLQKSVHCPVRENFSVAMNMLVQMTQNFQQTTHEDDQRDVGPFILMIANKIRDMSYLTRIHAARNKTDPPTRRIQWIMSAENITATLEGLLLIYDDALSDETKATMFSAAMNLLRAPGRETPDMALAVRLIARMNDIQDDATRRAAGVECVQIYHTFETHEFTVDYVSPSILTIVFREIQRHIDSYTADPHNIHEDLMQILNVVTKPRDIDHLSHRTSRQFQSRHLLYTFAEENIKEPIIYELSRLLYAYLKVFKDDTLILYVPTLYMFRAFTSAFAHGICDASQQVLASTQIQNNSNKTMVHQPPAHHFVHIHPYITPLGVVYRIIEFVTESSNMTASTESTAVAEQCCLFLFYTLTIPIPAGTPPTATPPAIRLHAANCDSIDIDIVRLALTAIAKYQLNTELVNKALFSEIYTAFEHMFPNSPTEAPGSPMRTSSDSS